MKKEQLSYDLLKKMAKDDKMVVLIASKEKENPDDPFVGMFTIDREFYKMLLSGHSKCQKVLLRNLRDVEEDRQESLKEYKLNIKQ